MAKRASRTRTATRVDGRVWRLCVRRVVRKRCPQCGVGALFARHFRLAERCAHCGLVYRRAPGAQTGSMYVCAAVTEVFAALLIVLVVVCTDWTPGVAMAVGIPLVLAFSYAFLPYSMALWVGADYLTDVGNNEWWAEVRLDGADKPSDGPVSRDS